MTEMKCLVDADAGVKPLSLRADATPARSIAQIDDHFGFLDGNSDPVLRKSVARQALPGIRSTSAKFVAIQFGRQRRAVPGRGQPASPPLRDGSFLAVRKLRQDVEALEQALVSSHTAARFGGGGSCSSRREDILEHVRTLAEGPPERRPAAVPADFRRSEVQRLQFRLRSAGRCAHSMPTSAGCCGSGSPAPTPESSPSVSCAAACPTGHPPGALAEQLRAKDVAGVHGL